MNPPTGSWVVRAGATFAVLVVAFVVIASFVVPPFIAANPQAAIAVPIGTAILVGLGALIALRATRDQQGAVEGVLTTTAPWLPGALAVAIVSLFLLGQPAPYAIGAGLLITAVGWLAIGFLFTQYARVDTAQSRNYAELIDRFTRLQADVGVLAADARVAKFKDEELENAQSAREELRAFVASIGADLGVVKGTTPASGRTWALGTGYIDLWNRLHRAEEALIDLAADPNIIASALHDRLRLDGSSIGHSKELIDRLDAAVKTLRSANTSAAERVEARRELRNGRRDINTYRDGVWDQMLDSRNQLLTRMIFTGAVADLVLVLALVVGADQTVVLGAAAFYLVGAAIGLFSRLQAESSTKSVVDDYGLADARLMVTPLISGLAAIAGVVLTAKLILPGSDVLAPASVDESGKTRTVASEVRTAPELSEIFDLDANAGGLVVAAVFGLTPGLLLERLKSEAEKYKSDLKTSTATDGKQ